MRKVLIPILTTVVTLIIMLCIPILVHAQPDPGGDPDAVPIDGGISLLIAAGVAYGVKKVRDQRKGHNKNNDQQEQI